ncbi:MAG: DUF1801 domain-containing protein [Gammaproteobacteria bacterium]|nr:DUF1801 domain-containing protein [Gammaproteobacteria bacterium]
MQQTASTPKEYLDQLPAERQPVMRKIRTALRKNLPKGFKEEINYNMIGYVVPHRLYPDGYHVNPELPLPFINLASQKSFIALYHMGIYSDPKLLEWFKREYENRVEGKLDMGKSCIRFKKPERVPIDLIGELAAKVTPEQWIKLYEKSRA